MKKLISAPYLLWMAVFIIVPLIMVAYFAFTTADGAFTPVSYTHLTLPTKA